MTKTKLVTVVSTLILLASTTVLATTLDLYNFSAAKVGNFPSKWRYWPLQKSKVEKVYAVAEENGDRFIRAVDNEDISQQIFLNFNWETEKYPTLNWAWRPTSIPEGGNESNDDMNDSACGLYVIIGQYSGHAIKYVWSSTLPPGKVVTRKDGKLKIKVLDSGTAKIGQWISHSVNVLNDYKELFGGDLKKEPSGIAILSDGNAVHKKAGCDYKGFQISSEK